MLWTTVRIKAMSRVTEPRGEGTVEELFQGDFSSFVLALPPLGLMVVTGASVRPVIHRCVDTISYPPVPLYQYFVNQNTHTGKLNGHKKPTNRNPNTFCSLYSLVGHLKARARLYKLLLQGSGS